MMTAMTCQGVLHARFCSLPRLHSVQVQRLHSVQVQPTGPIPS